MQHPKKQSKAQACNVLSSRKGLKLNTRTKHVYASVWVDCIFSGSCFPNDECSVI